MSTPSRLARISTVLTVLGNCARRHLMKRGSGQFEVPKLAVKIRRVEKPAQKARKGHNPATGEEISIKAKPARQALRAVLLKGLRDVLT